MDVSCRLPLLVRHTFPLLFRVGVWYCRPAAWFLTCLGVDGDAPPHVNVIVLPCGSTVLLDRALPVVWTFVPAPYSCASYPSSLLGVYLVVLMYVGFLSELPYRVQCCSVLCGHSRLSLMLGRGLGSRDILSWPFHAGSLFLCISPSIYAWGWPRVAFGWWLARWIFFVEMAWFLGRFVLGVSFLFYQSHYSSAAGRGCCCAL